MVKEPESMDDLLYFTNRTLENDGWVRAWVYKNLCPKCKKEKLSKPRDPKTGKVKIRSKEYVCTACGYTVDKTEYEPTLQLEAKFKCPHCGKEGEGTTQYKRKTISGIPTYRVICPNCQGNIDITKKMKEKKKKKKK